MELNEGKMQSESKSSGMKGLIQLVGCIAAVLVFMLVLAPFLDRAPLVQPLIQFIDEREIDAGAMFYTEIEEFSDAANYMNNSMDYSPGRRIVGAHIEGAHAGAPLHQSSKTNR